MTQPICKESLGAGGGGAIWMALLVSILWHIVNKPINTGLLFRVNLSTILSSFVILVSWERERERERECVCFSLSNLLCWLVFVILKIVASFATILAWNGENVNELQNWIYFNDPNLQLNLKINFLYLRWFAFVQFICFLTCYSNCICLLHILQ